MPPKSSRPVNTVVLRTNEFIYVLNRDSGEVTTRVGPSRISLSSNEVFHSDVQRAMIVKDMEYIVVLNPDGKMGSRKIVEGPCSYVLKYNEQIQGGEPSSKYLLQENEALLIEATADQGGHRAGERYLIAGPACVVPQEYENVLRIQQTHLLGHNEGIYVKNIVNSSIRLEVGPKAFMLSAEEELHDVSYDENTTRALAAEVRNRPSSAHALSIHLDKGEGCMVEDFETNKSKTFLGPVSYVLGPSERVKIIDLSAGKPKRNNQLKIAKLRLGPILTSDKITVFTKDNAGLELLVTYSFVFLVNEKTAYKMFNLNDPIGNLCQTACSEIREVASKHTFEEFHNATVGLILKSMFRHRADLSDPDSEPILLEEAAKVGQGNHSQWTKCRWFASNRMALTQVDVKGISPLSDEIASELSESIKANISILCKKLEQQAQLELQKSRLAGQSEIQELKGQLIELQSDNYRLEHLERSRVTGLADVEKAKFASQAIEIESSLDAELQHLEISKTMAALAKPAAARYVELQRIKEMGQISQNWILSSDSRYIVAGDTK